MSYKLQNLKHGFFPVPHEIMDGIRTLTAAECKLLLFLYAEINRLSSPCLRISSSQLRSALGMDAKTIRAARQGLESKHRIRCSQGKPGAPIDLHMLNPETGEPFPPEVGRAPVAEFRPRIWKEDGTASENAECRPVSGPIAARVLAKVATPETPPAGAPMRSIPRRDAERACPIHPNARQYIDYDGGEWHCEKCKPSPYAPPEDATTKVAVPAQQLTWNEMYGRA